MRDHRSKQEMVAREESRRKDSELVARPVEPLAPLPTPPSHLCDKIVLRDIWVQEAALLVQQVRSQSWVYDDIVWPPCHAGPVPDCQRTTARG